MPNRDGRDWKLAPIIVLAAALAGCRAAPAPPPYLFIDHLESAETKLASSFTLRSETRRALAVPLALRVSFELRAPSNATLRFALGVSTLDRPNLLTAVGFAVLVDSGSGEERIFSETLRRSQSNRWFPREVDLSRFAGERLRIIFATERVAEKRPQAEAHLLPLWGNPVLADRSATPGKPNVILISIDCLRADHLSTYGYERETSPHIDAFAREAAVFETAIAASSYTLPTHAAMLTGLPPSLHGAILARAIAPSAPYVPEALARAGYRVNGIVASPLLSQSYGFHRGFHTYRATGGRSAHIVERALRLLREGEGQAQFFFLHLFDLHWPYSPPKEFRTRFGERPENISELLQRMETGQPPQDEREIEQAVTLYDGELAYADEEIHRFFEELKARGLYETSLIIVTADHGEAFYEHESWTHGAPWRNGKPGLYEEIVHVPLIVKWPRENTGRRVQNPVSQMAVASTILEAAGIEPSTPWSSGLRRFIDDDATESTRPTMSEVVSYHHGRGAGLQIAFRDQDFKYIASFGADNVADLHETTPIREELYDLRRDPGEQDDLSDDSNARLDAFRATLRSYLDAVRELAPQSEGDVVPDKKLLEELRSLGYVEP